MRILKRFVLLLACSAFLSVSAIGQPAPYSEDPPVEDCSVQIVVSIEGVITASCIRNNCGRCGLETFVTPSGAIQYTCFCATPLPGN